jgi:hypothetical protein
MSNSRHSGHAMEWFQPDAQTRRYVPSKPSETQPIAGELVSLGEWAFSENPYNSAPYGARTYENATLIRDVWLVSRKENLSSPLGVNYLSSMVKVPDLHTKQNVLLEEEYYREVWFPPVIGSGSAFRKSYLFANEIDASQLVGISLSLCHRLKTI